MTSISPTVFLGGGRITSALMAGLRLAGDRRRIVVYDRNREKMRRLRQELDAEIAPDLSSAVAGATMLIVAVRPASVAELLSQIAACETMPRLCVSLAAGVPLSNLCASLPAVQWVRAMPSPVCRVARGLTALCFSRATTTQQRSLVRNLFTQVGQVVEVPENRFDAFTAAYSSSHGYHALATLAAAAHEAGLDRKTALAAAAHALADGIGYWRDSGLSLDELLHEAATPGGIAAATMRAMDKAGYRRVVAKGLAAGMAQARKNAKR
jgi:pyrroline-5-carboxylate reductase